MEASKTILLRESGNLIANIWLKARLTVAASTAFPLFASGEIFLLTGNGGAGGDRYVYQVFTQSTHIRTFSAFLRRGAGNFAHIIGGGDPLSFANFDLATGGVGRRGTSVATSTVQPWKDGWYRCTLTTTTTRLGGYGVCLVMSATSNIT